MVGGFAEGSKRWNHQDEHADRGSRPRRNLIRSTQLAKKRCMHLHRYSLNQSCAMRSRRFGKTPLCALAPAVSAIVVELRGVGVGQVRIEAAEQRHRVLANNSYSVIASRISCRCHRLPRRRAAPHVEQRTLRLLALLRLHSEHCTPAGDRCSMTAHRLR